MSFNPQQSEKKTYELTPEGLYGARLARVIELGTQADKYGEKAKVLLGFTVPSLTVDYEGEEKQKMIWANNFGLNQTSNPDSTLMKYVGALDKDATHLKDLLGKPCMLEIKHSAPKPDGSVYANVNNVTKPMAGLDIAEPDCDVYMYEFENGEDEIFEQLGEYRQTQIRAAVNFGQE